MSGGATKRARLFVVERQWTVKEGEFKCSEQIVPWLTSGTEPNDQQACLIDECAKGVVLFAAEASVAAMTSVKTSERRRF